jgi:hypothetical protein
MSVINEPNTNNLSGLFNVSQWTAITSSNLDGFLKFPTAQGTETLVGAINLNMPMALNNIPQIPFIIHPMLIFILMVFLLLPIFQVFQLVLIF